MLSVIQPLKNHTKEAAFTYVFHFRGGTNSFLCKEKLMIFYISWTCRDNYPPTMINEGDASQIKINLISSSSSSTISINRICFFKRVAKHVFRTEKCRLSSQYVHDIYLSLSLTLSRSQLCKGYLRSCKYVSLSSTTEILGKFSEFP